MAVELTRQRVTWVRTEGGKERISHPYLWIHVDEEGTERSYDTKGEALEAERERAR